MHPKFMDILCCPETGERFSLEIREQRVNGLIITGALRTRSGRTYPIIRGVPRFVSEEAYADSFGVEWNRWPRTQFEFENIGRPMEGHTTRMWDRITHLSPEEIRDKTIVEFGCGPGRFLDIVRSKGGYAVGIDLSSAVDAARENFRNDPDVLIVQGDLLNPPFLPGVMDGGYSIGVLHHTPNPAAGVASLANVIRPDGWLACCVYSKDDFYDFPSVQRVRTTHRALKPYIGYAFATAYAYASAYGIAPILQKLKEFGWWKTVQYIERNLLVCVRLRDPRWRLLDIFDAITPQIATTHTPEEVRGWLEQAGCNDVRTTYWCPTSFAGRRAIQAVAEAMAA
jgi:SAM-dependent methyltransferase